MRIGDKTDGYDLIIMNTGNERNRPLYTGRMLDLLTLLFNGGVWNGPVIGEWPSKLIVNTYGCFQLVYILIVYYCITGLYGCF
jgi:hypothetical protein